MDSSRLKDIVERQRLILGELEAETRLLDSDSIIAENTEMKARLVKASIELERSTKELDALRLENAGLKKALFDQVYSERLSLLDQSRRKMDVYFRSRRDGELNRIAQVERNIRQRMDAMAQTLRQYGIDANDEIWPRLGELSDRLNRKVTAARAYANQFGGAHAQNERAAYESIRDERVTDEMIKEAARKSSIESFVGHSLLNKLGILLIVIGAIVAGRYTFALMPDAAKCIAIFALGAMMLGAGEFMNRHKASIASIGVSAGGLAVLYVALGTSYFYFGLLGMYPAIALCVLITSVAFLLSMRYRAQAILAFALIGGYLPILSLDAGAPALLFGAMVYFIALNALALLTATRNKWKAAPFIGLGLNIAGSVYICLQARDVLYGHWASSPSWFPDFPGAMTIAGNFPYGGRMACALVSISYVFLAFAVYTMIPVIRTVRLKEKFLASDVALLAVNTFFSCLVMYGAFAMNGLGDYNGLLAMGFAAVYIALGWYFERTGHGGKHIQALFYLTGLVFLVLVVPLQFGRAWLSLGWLAQGTALAFYGIVSGQRRFKRAGLVIGALCLGAFLLFDVALRVGSWLLPYKYTAIAAASIILLAAYIHKGTLSSGFERVYKYAVHVNLWVYAMYMILARLPRAMDFDNLNGRYLCHALAITATFLLGAAAPRIRVVSDPVVKTISIVMSLAGALWVFFLNATARVIYGPALFRTWRGDAVAFGIYGGMAETPAVYVFLGTAILAVFSIIAVWAVYDLAKSLVADRKMMIEWLPLLVSAYSVVLMSQVLIAQYGLRFSNVVLTIIYVVAALAWIIYGMARRYAVLRRVGLGLSVLAVAKLFLIDIRTTGTGYQIISYFALGAALVAISFVYQHFSKRLELDVGAIVPGADPGDGPSQGAPGGGPGDGPSQGAAGAWRQTPGGAPGDDENKRGEDATECGIR
jgi:hypothetical protein